MDKLAIKVLQVYFFLNKVGLIVVCIVFVYYLRAIHRLPPADVYSTGLVFFGITTILSGLCFSFGQILKDEKEINSAYRIGESLIHSSLLNLIVLGLCYIYNAVLLINWLQCITVLYMTIKYLFLVLVGASLAMSGGFVVNGINRLNNLLTKRYSLRNNKLK